MPRRVSGERWTSEDSRHRSCGARAPGLRGCVHRVGDTSTARVVSQSPGADHPTGCPSPSAMRPRSSCSCWTASVGRSSSPRRRSTPDDPLGKGRTDHLGRTHDDCDSASPRSRPGLAPAAHGIVGYRLLVGGTRPPRPETRTGSDPERPQVAHRGRETPDVTVPPKEFQPVARPSTVRRFRR